jgi:hypothetical protein
MEKILQETIELLTNGKPYSYYLSGFILSFAAIILSLLHHSLSRDRLSPNTPQRFSFWFLMGDNTKRILAGMIVMYFLFMLFDFTSPAAKVGVGFGVAFGLDKMIQFLIEHTNIANFIKPARKNEQ